MRPQRITRSVKTGKEIGYLYSAAKVTVEIFKEISSLVKPGVLDRTIRDEIERQIKKRGLRRSFKTIVGCGANAADPHAKVVGNKVAEDDLVVIDFGVVLNGYHSDLTRTVVVGNPGKRLRKIYNAVEIAQNFAIKRIRPGLRISDYVKSVNDIIRKKRLGKFIRHTLGHGVGRRVHEAPKLSQRNKRRLLENMVVTIEPGLYINKKGGARIEDMVLVTEKGPKVLTR